MYGQSVLRKKAKPVRSHDDELIKFVDDMFETMRKAGGIGLAANQVGVFQRVIVVDVSEMEETKDQVPIALINPEVLSEEGEYTMEEGCLSIPEVREEVDRPEVIRVTYKDLEFKDQELVASGLVARVILHEIDHLNGVLFIDYLDPAKKKLLRGRLNKIQRGELEVSYPIVSDVQPVGRQSVQTK
jgi:peptide deformylase